MHENALNLAVAAAQETVGSTAPNPPVGAVALDSQGRVLSCQAHQGAGTPHAEALILADLRAHRRIGELATLVVTLEPCNHHGRTPPCAIAIVQAARTDAPLLRTLVYGVSDPNEKASGGAKALLDAGISLVHAQHQGSKQLLRQFSKLVRTGLPWVTVKTAHRAGGSMIPEPGQKTFTSPSSLLLAHQLRKRADAILTGSGTILADNPEFTVRHLPDHPGRRRKLVILDRRGRVPKAYLAQRQLIMDVQVTDDFDQALRDLGAQGCLEVLVEAGPTLSEAALQSGHWDEHVLITRRRGDEDRVETRIR